MYILSNSIVVTDVFTVNEAHTNPFDHAITTSLSADLLHIEPVGRKSRVLRVAKTRGSQQ